MSGLVGRWVEHFTLRTAVSAAEVEDAETRAERRVLLAHARQKLAAADALRPLDQRGAALALVVEALSLLVEASGVPSPREALAALGVSDADEVASRLASYASQRPVLDAAFSGADENAHARLRAAASEAERGASSRASSVPALRSVALTRSLAALAFGLIVLVVVVLLALPRPRVLVEPSTFHGPAYVAANARDGDPETDWLLPDALDGYLDLRLSPPRTVHSVTLVNAHNPPFNDRGTKGWSVELWSGAQKVASRDGDWAFTPTPAPTEVAVTADGVDRIRFVVKSHHQRGGGLAEISFR
jgi:hypothetical protein